MEPHLDMDSRPSLAHDHRVTLVQAREFNLIIEQKQWEKQKKLKHAVSKHSVSRSVSRGTQLHA